MGKRKEEEEEEESKIKTEIEDERFVSGISRGLNRTCAVSNMAVQICINKIKQEGLK